MNILPIKTPSWIKSIFHNLVWDIKLKNEKKLYLTFDDGPIPEITEFVLDTLKEYNAKATFFCIGDNIDKHLNIFHRINNEGHSIGNHTQNHINCWKVSTNTYLENIHSTQNTIEKNLLNSQKLFRPPHGKLSIQASKKLRNSGYKIIMWDILSMDWDSSIDKEVVLKNITEHAVNGSIIVFHDSQKAAQNMQYALPKVLAYFKNKGYIFSRIEL